jgi:hypothetical protein
MDGIKCCWLDVPLGYISFHFTQLAVFHAGCICSAYYYDGAKQAERKRQNTAQKDYQTNTEAKMEIEALQQKLNSIEVEKLDKIIQMLEEMKK